MSDYVLVQHESPLATIIFNRPDQRNAISYDMWRELASTLADLDSDQDIRTIVFAGAGDEAFSAGADIKDFQEYRSDSQKGALYNDAVNGLLAQLHSMATPTISMIDGFAVGGGCELAIATDLRIASEGSRFGIPTLFLCPATFLLYHLEQFIHFGLRRSYFTIIPFNLQTKKLL